MGQLVPPQTPQHHVLLRGQTLGQHFGHTCRLHPSPYLARVCTPRTHLNRAPGQGTVRNAASASHKREQGTLPLSCLLIHKMGRLCPAHHAVVRMEPDAVVCAQQVLSKCSIATVSVKCFSKGPLSGQTRDSQLLDFYREAPGRGGGKLELRWGRIRAFGSG